MVRRRTRIWLIAVGFPVILIAILAVVWGADLLLPLVNARASAALGRPVHIAHLHIAPGRTMRITADDVVVGNPPNWEGEPFARIPRLVIEADAWAYLTQGVLIIPLVELHSPTVNANQAPGGQTNYQFQLASGGGPGAKIGNVRIDDGHARITLAKLQADITLDVATKGDGDDATLQVDAKGTYAAQPITGRLIGGALLSLRDPARPWPVDLTLHNGPTSVALQGTLTDPLALQGASLTLQFAGPDMELLEKLIGIPIPKTPNYQLTGRLDFAEGRIQFRDMRGRVGNSDVAGTFDVDPTKEPPELTADLTSQRVDLADLGGFIGAQPGRTTTTGATPAERAQVAKAEASSKLLPDTQISIPKLRWANIHLRYKAQHIQGRSMPLDNLVVALDVVDGKIDVHPVSFAVGSGAIKANIVMTPQGDITRTKADIDVQRVDVSRLMAATHLFQGAGTLSGTGTFEGNGNSVAQMLANGTGVLRLGMAGGDLSAILVDLSGLEFGNALLSALGLPKRTTVECFIGDFALQRGTFGIQSLLLDTESAIINVGGGVNLKDEALGLQLRTEAKHFTIGSFPAPINVTGTLKHPSIAPGGELFLRGGLAAGLGIAFPPLALLPTIQLGVGDDHRCEALLARGKQQPGGGKLPAPAASRR